MSRVRWQDRVVLAPDLHHGDPCIKGTRVPVAMILGSLTAIDIQAALAYAADSVHQEVLAPLPA